MLDIRCILFQSRHISKKTYFKVLFEVVCGCHSKLFCLDVDQKLWSPFFNEIGFNCIKLSSKKVCSPILSREKKNPIYLSFFIWYVNTNVLQSLQIYQNLKKTISKMNGLDKREYLVNLICINGLHQGATVIQIENYSTEIIGDLKWPSSKFFQFFGLKW